MFTNPIKHKSKNRNHKKVAGLGGGWDSGADAGAFYWDLDSAASNRGRNRNISRQLVNARNRRGFPRLFQYKSVFLKDRATWQNRQPPKGGS